MSIWFDSMVFLKTIKHSHNSSNISPCLCLFKTWNYVPIDAYLSWIKYSRSEKLLTLISFRKEFHHRCVTREKWPYCRHPWVNFSCKISLRPLSCIVGECLLKCPNSKLPCPKNVWLRACGACLTSPSLCNLFLFYVNLFVPSYVHSYDVITTPDGPTCIHHRTNLELPKNSMVKACLNVFLIFQLEDMIEF